MGRPILIGKEFKKNGKWFGIFICPECQKHWETNVYSVHSGAAKRCRSCASKHSNRTHGRSNDKEYKSWSGMFERCFNSNNQDYERYGRRGITICERWEYFENFIADLGDCPEGLTLERTDNNGNYCPENCRWATQSDQARNTSDNIYLTDNTGETKLLIEWAKIKGIAYSVMYDRYYNGWSEHEIIHGKE